ncbi:MAG TPA: FAD-dependent monooxygenase, partial [Candidatus Angelobacter sp.]|nr:FAD-dependent monooxygenase [Candidatus Angelobacter sp.]
TVRQGLGLNFPGGTYEQLFYVVDVQATGLALTPEVNACISSESFVLAFPVRSSGSFRLIGIVPQVLAGQKGLTFEEIRPYVKKQIDVDVQKVNWFSTYHVHHRVADHFRQGRVFIAGDAGHVHSPAGGQGMNTGIGDAVNLAWKLATVIRGRTNPTVLDTYESERIAYARTLVASTDRLFQFAVGEGLGARIVRGTFLRYIAPLVLHLKAARKAQFRLVSQTRIHYRDSSALSSGAAGQLHGGDRLPWIESQNNFQPLSSLDWQIHVYGKFTPELHTLSARWNIPIQSYYFDKDAQAAGFVQDAAYLVRPDGHIAMAQANQSPQPMEQFLAKWIVPAG